MNQTFVEQYQDLHGAQRAARGVLCHFQCILYSGDIGVTIELELEAYPPKENDGTVDIGYNS